MKSLMDDLYGFCMNQLLYTKPTELFYLWLRVGILRTVRKKFSQLDFVIVASFVNLLFALPPNWTAVCLN